MTLLLRPPGRGNWTPVLLRLDGPCAPLLFRVNERLHLGGQVYRIAKVQA